MSVGPKIKEYRTKVGLTQKDLADQLHVTYQAVSRWENDEAEPSIDTLKEMCKIFNCSINELFEMEKKEEPKEEKVTVVEKVVVQEGKPILAVCEKCNKPIYDGSDLNRVDETVHTRVGRSTRTDIERRIICNSCNEARLQKLQEQKEQAEKEFAASLKRKRIKSFVWSSIATLLTAVLAIGGFVKGYVDAGLFFIVVSVIIFFFVGTLILDNTFISEMWLTVASWGFVRMPGVIFEFSIDGFIFLIVIKIIFFVLGILLALISAAFATALAAALCIFVYPYALSKNLKGIE